ncbi:MAG: DUF1343 domain-containing protein [Balneola sp.]|nr:MAG: DUF1343 domain-containing protein [Balneola sp.]
MKYITVLITLLLFADCEAQTQSTEKKVKIGAEVLIEKHLDKLDGKRVGLVMNPTARIEETHMLDTLISLGINVTALFAPEHGFRGEAGAGERIEDGVDAATGLPVHSLYGNTKKPSAEMLQNVDLLIFDMQDVGARFYTYNSTMKHILEAGAEFDKEVWILDRPNPAGGDYVSGWVLEEEHKSFVGSYPIPVAHGLTLGELALMAKGEGWLEINGYSPNVKVIEMEGWNRVMKWSETGLNWFPPSPNLPSFEHAYLYLGTCLFEGTTLSEGRGTPNPFLTIGSPKTFINLSELRAVSEKYSVIIDTVSIVPRSIPGKARYPKYEDEKIFGVKINATPDTQDPVRFGVELVNLLMEKTEDAEYSDFIYLLAGTKKIIDENGEINWGEEFEEFLIKRKQYLIYR